MSQRPKLRGGWRLWLETLTDFKRGWKIYLLVILIVALPLRLLSLAGDPSADAGIATFTVLASLFMNLALLSVASARFYQQPINLRQAYYHGTAHAVPYLLVCLFLAVCLIPMAFSVFVLVVASYGQSGGYIASGIELLLVMVLALALSVPTVWLLGRYILAVVGATVEGQFPVASIKAARRLTRGRFWSVLGRYVVLLLGLTLIIGVLWIITAGLQLLFNNAAALNFIFQLFLSAVGLPLATIYLVRLYHRLQEVQA